MLGGMLLAVITYKHLFNKLVFLTDEKIKTEIISQQETKTTMIPVAGTQDMVRTVARIVHYEDGMVMTTTTKDTAYQLPGKLTQKPEVKTAKVVGNGDYWHMVLVVFIMILYVTMVYGPIAAFLVEMFPTKIRYTSMSLPYHIGNGVFGGLTPFIATLLTTIYTADKMAGLMYPIIVAAVCLVIGTLYISNRIDPNVND